MVPNIGSLDKHFWEANDGKSYKCLNLYIRTKDVS